MASDSATASCASGEADPMACDVEESPVWSGSCTVISERSRMVVRVIDFIYKNVIRLISLQALPITYYSCADLGMALVAI